MSESTIHFNRRDVTLEEIPVELCEECFERPATHYLQIDLRCEGWTTTIGERSGFCEECGKEALERIHATMPEPLNDEGTQP